MFCADRQGMSISGTLVDCLIENTTFSNTGADGFLTAPACGEELAIVAPPWPPAPIR